MGDLIGGENAKVLKAACRRDNTSLIHVSRVKVFQSTSSDARDVSWGQTCSAAETSCHCSLSKLREDVYLIRNSSPRIIVC